MSPTVIVDDRARLVKTFVELVEEAAAEAVAARGRFCLAVTGGGDARVFLPPLVESRVDWKSTDVFWGDERAVPPGHADSNYGQVKAAWLDRAPVTAARVHRMPGEHPDLDQAARDYQAALVVATDAHGTLDVIFLGVGPDGHVCSIFPGHPLLEERRSLVVPIVDSPKPPPRRLTLTLPVLERARLVLVTAQGEAKAAVVRAAIEDPSSMLPLAQVVRGAEGRVVLLLDADAAGRSLQ